MSEITTRDFTAEEAREFVEYVRTQQDELPRRTIDAYQRRAWLPLGYGSWAEFVDGEDLRLPREVTPELRAGGLSIRAIAAVQGVAPDTVQRDLREATVRSGQENRTVPERITGLDGKSRPASRAESKPVPEASPDDVYVCDRCGGYEYEDGGDGMDDQCRCYDDDAVLDPPETTKPTPKPEKPKREPVMLSLRTHTGEEVLYPKPQAKPTFNETSGDGISWAAWSWNPVTGCLHGCDYCYARAIIHRYGDANPAGFTPLFHEERLDAPANTTIPAARLDDPAYRRVFVCSMADLYGRWVPDEWINRVHTSMLTAPDWEYLLLTKFPRRYVGLDLPPNAWVGTSVDEQKRVRIAEDAFRQIDGVKVKWLSLEPLKEPLEFTDLSMFDWVVIGAQTETYQPGGTVPAFAPPWEWVCRITAQAKEAGCAVHWKPNLFNGRPGLPLNEYPGVSL